MRARSGGDLEKWARDGRQASAQRWREGVAGGGRNSRRPRVAREVHLGRKGAKGALGVVITGL